jgi:hypothetical protein
MAVVNGPDGLGYVALRRAGEHEGHVLVFTQEEWGNYLLGVRNGEFDLPETPEGQPSGETCG